MRTQSRTGRISKLAILAILMALPIFTGSPFCSKDEDKPIEVVLPKRGTPKELLTNWFPNAYNNQDSIRYEEMLDTEFQFEFLTEDAESLIAHGQLPPGSTYWAKLADLSSTGAMFRSDNVGDISLNITIDDTSTVNDPNCGECKLIQATIDLRVTTQPNDPEPLTLAVNSPQEFMVRPDPDDPTQWVIYR